MERNNKKMEEKKMAEAKKQKKNAKRGEIMNINGHCI